MNSMQTHYPPRREPRVLAVLPARRGLAFAVVDPWEIRAAGIERCGPESIAYAIVRLVRREKAVAIACGRKSLLPAVKRAAAVTRIGFVAEPPPTLPVGIAADLYPELAVHAPTKRLKNAAAVAIAAVLHSNIPSRKYAACRK